MAPLRQGIAQEETLLRREASICARGVCITNEKGSAFEARSRRPRDYTMRARRRCRGDLATEQNAREEALLRRGIAGIDVRRSTEAPRGRIGAFCFSLLEHFAFPWVFSRPPRSRPPRSRPPLYIGKIRGT